MSGDPNWSGVSLLLSCDGSNNSTTFTDSSDTPKTVTPSGNANISTAQSKWGGSSARFDGNGDYLTVSAALLGAGVWTAECWIYLDSNSGNKTIFSQYSTGQSNRTLLDIRSGKLSIFNGSGGLVSGTTTISTGQFHHVAFVRSASATVKAYLNGSLEATHSSFSTPYNTNTVIGSYPGDTSDWMNGYIDDIRFTNVARYSDNFSVPTNAFPDFATAILPSILHEVIYSVNNLRLHDAIYSVNNLRLHDAIYRVVFSRSLIHDALYSVNLSKLNVVNYRLGDEIARIHSTSWAVLSSVSHSALYEVVLASASTSANRIHEAFYSVIGVDPATSATSIHEVSYSGSEVAVESASAIHVVSYSIFVTARRLHEVFYKSIVADHRLHSASWRVDTDTRFSRIHETRYRTSDTDAIIDAGTVTVGDGNLRAYDFLDIVITADENSPYWQCEMTLKDAIDYVRFPRDAPFVIRLFGVDFAFIVDSRTLSRSIDDSGNALETCTISGLSPLVAKARPRAARLTKTWTDPELASSIVESLVGTATWNLVDWTIPAYRLAAERADPFEVAKQVVTAVGGLIESRPDGSVVCRHLWPTSIAALDSAVSDHTLDERVIYAASEYPTQDELIDLVRVYDGEAAFQDRLEYVPNKIGESDDPRNGVLYAFVSPWRDGLRIITTRPSKISVGPITEGTRTIGDDNPGYPAEIVTFSERTGSTQYPILSLTSLDWLDENLGSATVQPYSTTIDAGIGSYGGYSLAKVQYVARYLSVPVHCVETVEEIEAQFLLLENQDG